MIFISHTAADKHCIDPIAHTLAEVYGKENVFYDSWSIQPGDSIIGEMNKGLEQCEFFFLFVSKRSLKSEMVSLEWKNALISKSYKEIKFIPVKLDDCEIPSILRDTLYIDCYKYDLETIKRQIIDIIYGKRVESEQIKQFENVEAIIQYETDTAVIIEFTAKVYLEPISQYCIYVNNLYSLESVCDDSSMVKGENTGVYYNGKYTDILFFKTPRATAVNFPLKIKLIRRGNEKIEISACGHAISENKYHIIPCRIKNKANT